MHDPIGVSNSLGPLVEYASTVEGRSCSFPIGPSFQTASTDHDCFVHPQPLALSFRNHRMLATAMATDDLYSFGRSYIDCDRIIDRASLLSLMKTSRRWGDSYGGIVP